MQITLSVNVIHDGQSIPDQPVTAGVAAIGDNAPFDPWVAAELAPKILADTTAVPGDTVIADCISCENPGCPREVPRARRETRSTGGKASPCHHPRGREARAAGRRGQRPPEGAMRRRDCTRGDGRRVDRVGCVLGLGLLGRRGPQSPREAIEDR